MKNRLHVLMFTAMILLSSTAFAVREPNVNVSSQGENKLVMKLLTHEESTSVRIKDENGILLFSEKTGSESLYQKVFDMGTLKEGSYIIEVEGEHTIQLVFFNVSKGKLVLTEDIKTTYKPVIRLKEGLVDLQLLNVSEEPVKITFYNNSGNVLLRHAPETDIRLEKRFNLGELSPGTYSMNIQVGERSYLKQIVID
jgi:hypothetical protein